MSFSESLYTSVEIWLVRCHQVHTLILGHRNLRRQSDQSDFEQGDGLVSGQIKPEFPSKAIVMVTGCFEFCLTDPMSGHICGR